MAFSYKNLTYDNPSLPEGVPDTPCSSGVGKGWWPVVQATHKMMLRICPEYQLDQVKEKFGGLRYYWGMPNLYDKMPEDAPEDWEPDPADAAKYERIYEQLTVLADLAESICANLCETCGCQSKVSNQGGWYRNQCEDCLMGRVRR
jgi:hypothetical protein